MSITYYIKYNANGGIGTMQDSEHQYDVTSNLSDNAFIRTGYNFVGWNTKEDGSGELFNNQHPVINLESIDGAIFNLYAQWTPKSYTVTFDANGGTIGSDTIVNINIEYDSDSYKSIYDKLPVRNGYDFGGWYTGDGFQVYTYYCYCTNDGTYFLGGKWKFDDDVILYAYWLPQNSRTNIFNHHLDGFQNGEGNNNDGTKYLLNYTSNKCPSGDSFILNETKAIKIPNGFYLNNVIWAVVNENWEEVSFGSQYTQPDSDVIFHFYYTPYNYAITYELNGGINDASNPLTYNVLYGITLQNPTREGYEFKGWYIDNKKITGINEGCNASFGSTTEIYEQLATRSTGDIVVTAKWESIEQEYNASVYTNGSWKYGFLYMYHNGKWCKGDAYRL